jgi:GNAT superfamily N-acetyltransferase
MPYLTVSLHASHKKKLFSCGNILLDNYLHTQAKQDVSRKLAVCFILADKENNVQGYYTLSSASIPRELLPESIIKKLPPTYHNLPATLLGRLAVDNLYKRKGFGELLLIDALRRSYETAINSIGSLAVIVDPIDQNAVNFYSKYGFILLPDSGKMFMPMETIFTLFGGK